MKVNYTREKTPHCYVLFVSIWFQRFCKSQRVSLMREQVANWFNFSRHNAIFLSKLQTVFAILNILQSVLGNNLFNIYLQNKVWYIYAFWHLSLKLNISRKILHTSKCILKLNVNALQMAILVIIVEEIIDFHRQSATQAPRWRGSWRRSLRRTSTQGPSYQLYGFPPSTLHLKV